MKRQWLGVGAALLLAGCASVEMAKYTVTSFAEIPLKEQAKIKIVMNGDNLDPVVDAVKGEFAKSGSFGVVEENADYWFVFNGESQYVAGGTQRTVSVVEKEDDAGGSEELSEETRNLSSAARCVSIAVYETKTLTPIHYMEIPVYSGDNASEQVRSGETFDAAFAKEIAERVADAFITQKKLVETPVPLEADAGLRDLFLKGGEAFAKEGKGAYAAFLKAYKESSETNLAELCEQLRAGTYEGSDAVRRLSNYYLYLLVKEALVLDPVALRKIKEEQLMILRSCDSDGLAEAVPVALARLEYKLANISE
jgi:hypothetical protein